MQEPADVAHACSHDDGHAHSRASAYSPLTEHDEAKDAICIEKLSFTYENKGKTESGAQADGSKQVLDDITLHIEQGCNLGIVGPNGAGKTTLLKILLGLLDGYEGDVKLFGLSPRDACRQGNIIGYVPQRHQVEWNFPLSAEQVVRLGLVTRTGLLRGYSRADREYAREMMQQLGIEHLAAKPIGDLSGGQQQRVFVARALVNRPRILVLDEPMVGIDEPGRKQFSQLIHGLHESLDLTILMVSHDLQAIAAGCNRVACLNQTLHYHDVPSGLTEDVLREVFSHDIAPMLQW